MEPMLISFLINKSSNPGSFSKTITKLKLIKSNARSNKIQIKKL